MEMQSQEILHEHFSFWLVFYTQIKARVKEGTAPERFMSRLLTDKDLGKMSDEESAGLMASLLSAGSETTATALKWFFKTCTKYPGFILTAQEELDRVVGKEKMPDWEDQDKLPYVNATVKELHR
jgi:cytochrome P450